MRVSMELSHLSQYSDVVGKLFRDKEERAIRYEIDLEYAPTSTSSFDNTLMRLKQEMVQLMRCDVALYNQLTELNNSIDDLKDDFKQYQNFRTRASSYSTSSSDESFVSASDTLDVCHKRVKQTTPESCDNRVLSWINNCEQYPRVDGNSAVDYNNGFGKHRQRSGSYDGHRTKKIHSASERKLIREYNQTWRGCSKQQISGLRDHTDNSSPYQLRKLRNMKTLTETEIRSEEILSSYKRSLRLLGSVRMQNRIFEPIHSMYRPSILLSKLESLVSVPNKPYKNVQPRPKLHRQGNILELCETGITTEHSQLHTACSPKSMRKDLIHDSDITNVTQESEYSDDHHNDHVSSDDNSTLDSHDANKSDDGLLRADSGFNEESEEQRTDSELDADNDSETEIDSFKPEFLYTKDGLVTCRIMSPGLENELATRKPVSEDFEFLALVDGRVSFVPHDKDSNSDESYYLAWIFEDLEGDASFEDSKSAQLILDNFFDVTDDNQNDMYKHSDRSDECLLTGIECTECISEDPTNISIGVNAVKNSDTSKFEQKWSMDSGFGDDSE